MDEMLLALFFKSDNRKWIRMRLVGGCACVGGMCQLYESDAGDYDVLSGGVI